jgi:hypothetical protein
MAVCSPRWAMPIIIATLAVALSAQSMAEAKPKPPPRAYAAGVRCDLTTLSCGWKFNREQSVRLVHAARAGGIAAAVALCGAFSLPVAVPCVAVGTAVFAYVSRGGTIPPDKYLYVGYSVGREPIAKFVD